MKRFSLIGAAGYIAPRHMQAIRETGNEIAAAMDVNDSVGILDQYFPEAAFFTEFEQFDAFIHWQRRLGQPFDFHSICSPNYLHKSHIGFALRSGADAICEKPLVLSPDELDDLASLEVETGKRVNTVLQLRLHPSIIALRDKVKNGPRDKIYNVDLGYFTSRGAWYHASWKGFEQKSGGIVANIGVHFFDMLGFVFGKLRHSVVHYRSNDAAAGYLEYQQARVRWILSIDRRHLPIHTGEGMTTHRSITVEGQEIEFSGGFTDLHIATYQNILVGQGYGLDAARPSIELVSAIRGARLNPASGERHPDLAKVMNS